MRYWTARTEAACAQRLVNEVADFSPGEENSSEEAYNNPGCLQGQVIPPPVLGSGSVGSADERLILKGQEHLLFWCL